MKCKECGKELIKVGQKDVCPYCNTSYSNTSSGESTTSENPPSDLIKQIDSFVFQEGNEWDDFFDLFYDSLGIEMNYKELFDLCLQRYKFLREPREIMITAIKYFADSSSAVALPGNVVKHIMQGISTQFPEITPIEARRLAKILFAAYKKSHNKTYFDKIALFPFGPMHFKFKDLD